MGLFDFFSKKEKKEVLDAGLEKTKRSVFEKISHAIAGKSTVDEEVLDNLEEVLATSDVGVETTIEIIRRIEERVARDKYVSTKELHNILKEEIATLLVQSGNEDADSFELPTNHSPYVIMVVGVNGVGKTTTIGKLAYQFKQAGKKVYLGAADTFRAAAVEQLVIWGERVGVPVVKQQMGSDPASVAFDTIKSAVANAKAASMQSGSDNEKFIALDIGPTGKLLKPLGDLDFEEDLSFTANIHTIKEAWDALANKTNGKWQTLNFMTAYNGLPEDFDAKKILINTGEFLYEKKSLSFVDTDIPSCNSVFLGYHSFCFL